MCNMEVLNNILPLIQDQQIINDIESFKKIEGVGFCRTESPAGVLREIQFTIPAKGRKAFFKLFANNKVVD